MTEEIIAQLDHILELQLNDLKNCCNLAKANFLAAVGCMNTIEFLGGVRTGRLAEGGNVEKRFRAGWQLLSEVSDAYASHEEDGYALRNGLAHQYVPGLPAYETIVIANDPSGSQGLIIKGGSLSVNAARLVSDIELAWQRLRTELAGDQAKVGQVSNALARLPELL